MFTNKFNKLNEYQTRKLHWNTVNKREIEHSINSLKNKVRYLKIMRKKSETI